MSVNTVTDATDMTNTSRICQFKRDQVIRPT
jgi:hypothetical protein